MSNIEENNDREQALAKHLGCEAADIKPEYGNEYAAEGKQYLVVTDEEADELWEDDLQHYLDDYIYSELPQNLVCYFDDEKWKRDARIDGRAHSLSRYDGCEYDEEINGVTYYIYRTN